MNQPAFPQRDYSLDNIRFVLIFSVVFAHLLEVCPPFGGSLQIYKFLYSFHMPAFVFLFGYHAKFAPKAIVYRWFFPYIIFQCAYISFSSFVLKNTWIFKQLETIAQRFQFSLTDPIKDIPKEAMEVILFGGKESFSVASKVLGITKDYKIITEE